MQMSNGSLLEPNFGSPILRKAEHFQFLSTWCQARSLCWNYSWGSKHFCWAWFIDNGPWRRVNQSWMRLVFRSTVQSVCQLSLMGSNILCICMSLFLVCLAICIRNVLFLQLSERRKDSPTDPSPDCPSRYQVFSEQFSYYILLTWLPWVIW